MTNDAPTGTGPDEPSDRQPDKPPGGPVRGEIRSVGFLRVSHGLFRPDEPGLDAHQSFLRDLEAWRLVLPKDAVFTHVTAARLYGWQLPKLPEQVPVFAAVSGDPNRPRRPGLICSRLVRLDKPAERCGMPVDLPEEVLLRMARDLGTLDLVIVIDSARRAGDIDPDRLKAVLGSRRPGVRALRAAWELSSPQADSGGETVLRLFHDAMDVAVEPQAVLVDENGQVIGHADLLVSGTNLVHEYDGAHHRDGRQHTVDLRRERGLAGSAYQRRGFTLDDLLNHPIVAMHELDRALARPHRLARLTRWRVLVENSMYSEVGRRRVLNRWQRAMGVIDWSRTA